MMEKLKIYREVAGTESFNLAEEIAMPKETILCCYWASFIHNCIHVNKKQWSLPKPKNKNERKRTY